MLQEAWQKLGFHLPKVSMRRELVDNCTEVGGELMACDSSAKNTLYCSFCGKADHEVRHLITGATVCICDICVERCADILHKDPIEADLLQRAEMIVTGAEVDCRAFLS